jgi:hypothetical protein
LEETVRARIGTAGDFLPGQAGLQLTVAPDARAVYQGGVTLTLITLAFLVFGGIALSRRDIA